MMKLAGAAAAHALRLCSLAEPWSFLAVANIVRFPDLPFSNSFSMVQPLMVSSYAFSAI